MNDKEGHIKMNDISRKSEILKNKRLFLVVTVILAFILTGEIIVYAWFTGNKSLKTVTSINTPYRLNLGAGNKEAIERLSLGNIDVTSEKFLDGEGKGKSYYVFSVSSDFDASNPYAIQLSHTTNIAFDYTIYHAKELGPDRDDITQTMAKPSDAEGFVEYITLNENDETVYYYYCIDDSREPVTLEPQNIKDDVVEYKKTYDQYENIQEHAKPVYSRTGPIIPDSNGGTSFVDYYILEISWDKNNVRNDKETDLVYLMALRM